jgi:shikimate dehydrogenase
MIINKDTKLYGSFSDNPGNNGCLFFNSAFQKYNLNSIYKSFYSNNIEDTINAVKHLKFSGFALSKPLKKSVMKYLDDVDTPLLDIMACNTVLINDGNLKGYNTDWIGVYNFFKNKNLKHVNIIGFGGFGKAVMYAFDELKITYDIYHKNDIKDIDDIEKSYFINATPIDIVSNNNTIIDARPHTIDGKEIAKLQAIEQFELYTGIEYEQ